MSMLLVYEHPLYGVTWTILYDRGYKFDRQQKGIGMSNSLRIETLEFRQCPLRPTNARSENNKIIISTDHLYSYGYLP